MVRKFRREGQTSPATAGPRKKPQKAGAPAQRRRWPGVAVIALVVLVVILALIAAVAPELLPASPRIDADARQLAAAVIFATSYLALAVGKIPGLSIDRAGVALVGAGLMVASGALSLEDAY